MKKLSKNDVILFSLLAVCLIIVVVFSQPEIQFFKDETLNTLLCGIVPRLSVGMFLMYLLISDGKGRVFRFPLQTLGQSLVWCIPCFLVVLANFPFSALFNGTATVDRFDLVWLFVLQCFSVGLMEEIFFRGLLLPWFLKKFADVKNGVVIAIILSSVCFALMHLFNLFSGADIGATLLQVGYTFLTGCMFAAIFLKTENIYLAITIHALFNVGGTLIDTLGKGLFQDTLFWIFTAIAGVICCIHVLLSLSDIVKKTESKERKTEQTE